MKVSARRDEEEEGTHDATTTAPRQSEEEEGTTVRKIAAPTRNEHCIAHCIWAYLLVNYLLHQTPPALLSTHPVGRLLLPWSLLQAASCDDFLPASCLQPQPLPES